jgi:hypothetical protein
MGEAAYNLVTVKGCKADLDKFEKIAYTNESEAFCLKNFINYNGNSTAPHNAVFFTNWVAFGVLIEKTEKSLKYFFNSKWNAVNLRYIVDRFPELNFKQVYVEIATGKVGILDYKSDKHLKKYGFDYWGNSCSPHTYNFIEDVALKLEYLISQNKSDISGEHFYEEIDRSQFLKNHRQEYEELFKSSLELEMRDLYYARYGMFYTLHAYKKEELEEFIRINIQPEKQDEFLKELSKLNFNIPKERRWWNCLIMSWKKNLVSCLIDFNPSFQAINKPHDEYYEIHENIFKSIQISDEYLKDILKLDKLKLSISLLFDNLETVLELLPELNSIFLEFNGYEIEFESNSESFESIIEHLPENVFSKVKEITLDYIELDNLSILAKFPNLEVFAGQGCQINTLKGIEKSVNLKSFTADQGNYYSSLVPIKDLKLKYLNIQASGVRDLRPLSHMNNLKFLIAGGCEIEDYDPLLLLPKLLHLETEEFEIIEAKTNKAFKSKLEEFIIHKNMSSTTKLKPTENIPAKKKITTNNQTETGDIENLPF